MAISPETPIQRTTVRGIRDELRKLWASEAMSDEAVIRARTHNMVVYVADDVSAEETTRRVIERTGERPGRVIIIDVDPGQSGEMDAWVTTYCRSVNRHQICGEMITLTISPGHHEDVHSTVISLLAPDLPVYLWWGGLPDPADHLFSHLAPAADRLLVDSDTFEDGGAGLARLAALQQTHRIGDLAWARLSPWRQLLAQLWDVRELAGSLAQIRELNIEHLQAGRKNSGRARLLWGWLSWRLGWTVSGVRRESRTGLTVDWLHDELPGTSSLAEVREPSLSLGEIRQVSIRAGEKAREVNIELEQRPDHACIETRVKAGGKQSMKHSSLYRAPDDSRALAEELDLGYDQSYAAALQAAVDMVQLAEPHPGKRKNDRRQSAG